LLVGSLANAFCGTGGFCAGSKHVVDHQRINGASFVFSASMPASLAVSASEAIQILTNSPSTLSTLHENVRLVRSILDKVEGIYIPSHSASPLIHIQLTKTFVPAVTAPPKSPKRTHNLEPIQTTTKSNPHSVLPSHPSQFDIESEERILQEIVEEALAQGVLITRAKHLRGQEIVEPRPAIKLAVTAALNKKDIEKSTTVVKNAIVKVLARKKKFGPP